MSKYNDCGKVTSTQALDFTSASGSSTVFGSQTYVIRLAGTAAFHFHIFGGSDTTSTCTSADPLVPSTWVETINVTPGQKVSVIKASGGTVTSSDGRVTITELA